MQRGVLMKAELSRSLRTTQLLTASQQIKVRALRRKQILNIEIFTAAIFLGQKTKIIQHLFLPSWVICKVSSTNSIIYPRTFYFSSGSRKEAVDHRNIRRCSVWSLSDWPTKASSNERVSRTTHADLESRWGQMGGNHHWILGERETFKRIITF